MIVIGYQGIGKSTTARHFHGKRFIDLESSSFWVDGKRDPEWYIPYCQIALDLSSQGFIVFISSHKEVRTWFINNVTREEIYTCSPDIKLKDIWIEKLEKRYNANKTEKNLKALLNAKSCFTENVLDIQKDGEKLDGNIIINSTHYNLKKLILSVF